MRIRKLAVLRRANPLNSFRLKDSLGQVISNTESFKEYVSLILVGFVNQVLIFSFLS